MARKLSDEQWLEIRTKYQLGGAIRALARDFDIPESTIRAKVKSENWTQELRTQVTDIKNKGAKIAQDYAPAQLPLIQQELSAAVRLMNQLNSFITTAADINVATIQELQRADLPTRIFGLSKLKATMPELANLAGVQKDLAPPEGDDDSDATTVQWIEPDGNRA